MSIDSNSECVKSKYFASQTDMDESLSDFQEAKKSCKGPKPAQKTTKPRTRKTTKRIKGQKDIRTALKGKKNDLVSYSKDFDTVCKKSGLDVDSEQLQLAIALSKSLQTEPETPDTSQALTSQQRVAKIRKTLQEYGFKVPEAKITATKKTKKFRKNYKLLTATEEQKKEIITGKYAQILFQNIHVPLEQNRPNSLDSEARVFYIGSSIPYECMKDDEIFYVDNLVERSETNGSLLRDWSEIPGRPVSPLLFDSFKMSFKEIECSQDELDVILSGSIKNVKNIFASKEIQFENHVQKINIDDDKENVDCDNNRSQINNMIISIDDNDHECEVETKPLSQNLFDFESPVKNDMKSRDRTITEIKLPDDEVIEITSPVKLTTDPKKGIDIETTNNLTVPKQNRSCSPDIFDDELSSIMETTKPASILSQEHKTKVFSQDYVMYLTECVNIPSQGLEKTLLSQNITKRRSNDFMEITECVVGSSQPIREELKEIDLTQSPEANDAIKERNHSINVENNIDNASIILCTNSRCNSVSQNVTDEQNVTVLRKCPNTDSTQSQIAKEDVDLTQSSNEDDKDMKIVNLSNQTPDKKDVESMDLTQSSNSDDVDGLPIVNIGTQKDNSLDETIIVDKDEYIAIGKVKKSIVFEKETQDEVYDLTQAHDDSIEIHVTNENNDSQCYSFYDDYVHDHSENTENSKEVEQNKDKTKDDKTSHNESKESDDVDLTQDSDKSEERRVSQRSLVLDNIPNNSSLGKKDDISIDYDEIILDDNICHQESYKESDNDKSLNLKYESFKSDVENDLEIVDVNNDIDMNSSQHSEVFKISDRELDYSLHKSRHDFVRDNFDIGGISVLDNATKLSSFKKSLSEGCLSVIGRVKDDNLGDSFLPEVFTKKTENTIATTATYIHTPGEISPIKVQDVTRNDNGVIHIKTPKNTEYVIKTDNVTPMADYASMSTPQRNRELDKYGLKPFKRKRAVQILTHLYNQTHPTIQQLVDENQPSPSKKQRLNYDIEETSPQKLITSPAKLNQNSNTQRTPVKSRTLERDKDILSAPSPSKGGIGADVCVYEVTSETANLKSVDCDPDDWVFQKREKAKVHSCRVPLHIAFHNYVLSRRSLREAILKYEPVNIDIIHKDLVGYGHRYDPKDLLKFLDKKCITVKTTDNNSRNNKR